MIFIKHSYVYDFTTRHPNPTSDFPNRLFGFFPFDKTGFGI